MQYSLSSNRHIFILSGFHATNSVYPVQSFQLHATTKCIDSRKSPVFGKAPKKQADVERKNSVLKDWKLHNFEKRETVFMNKTNEGPYLSVGCKPCLKYHVKGLYYSDCRHQSSHRVPENDYILKTGKHINQLRGK